MRRSFKLLVILVVLAVGVSAVTAFAASSGAPPKNSVKFRGATPGSGKGLKIGYISLGESVPFVVLVTNSIKKQAKIAGAQLVVCDSALDAAKALDCAKNFKTQGVQGYLNFQLFANASAQICKAGPQVPVISIDIHQAPCEVAFMGANNAYAGYIAGASLGKYVKAKLNCKYDAFVWLHSSAAGVVDDLRLGGQQKGFESVCGKAHDVRKVDDADRIDKARTKFADVLTALPGKHAIMVVSINDDGIEGALAAAKVAGRVKDLYVSGTGADPSSWCLMKNNPQWAGDVAFYPERYGEIGVPYLIDAIKHKTVPKLLYVPHVVVNHTNLLKYYKPKGC
jgi:ribose transport system substrate-binding protein